MRKTYIAIVSAYILVYLLPLGVRPLMTPDEVRYGEVPREMLTSGDWVVPHLAGVRYFEKPVLGYWLSAVAMKLFGENAFAVRLPSALAAGLSALTVFLLVWRFGGGDTTALVAATVLLTSGLFASIGTFAILDSALTFFLTAAIALFFAADCASTRAARNGLLALFGLCCGLAFLVKGFLAFAVPVAVIVPYLVWERRWKDMFRMAWVPMLAALIVALPWAILIHQREPDFWRYFFWHEHIRRFFSHTRAQHAEPFWYFLPMLAGGALPWTLLLPGAAIGLRLKGMQDRLTRYALCWFVFPFLFFSACSGKIATYILPCFPPLAILCSIGLQHYAAAGHTRAFRVGAGVFATAIGIASAGLALVQVFGLGELAVYRPDETWKWVLAAAAGLGCTLCAAQAARANVPSWTVRTALIGAGVGLLFAVLPAVIPAVVLDRRAPGQFLLQVASRITPDTILVADKPMIQPACWFFRRTDVHQTDNSGELGHGLAYPDATWRLLSETAIADRLANSTTRIRIALIVEGKDYREARVQLPPDIRARRSTLCLCGVRGRRTLA